MRIIFCLAALALLCPAYGDEPKLPQGEYVFVAVGDGFVPDPTLLTIEPSKNGHMLMTLEFAGHEWQTEFQYRVQSNSAVPSRFLALNVHLALPDNSASIILAATIIPENGDAAITGDIAFHRGPGSTLKNTLQQIGPIQGKPGRYINVGQFRIKPVGALGLKRQ